MSHCGCRCRSLLCPTLFSGNPFSYLLFLLRFQYTLLLYTCVFMDFMPGDINDLWVLKFFTNTHFFCISDAQFQPSFFGNVKPLYVFFMATGYVKSFLLCAFTLIPGCPSSQREMICGEHTHLYLKTRL